MIEEITIGLLFAGAALYLGNMVRKSFSHKGACPKGCGSCGKIDIDKIEAAIKQKNNSFKILNCLAPNFSPFSTILTHFNLIS
jgi:hypothetical protein